MYNYGKAGHLSGVMASVLISHLKAGGSSQAGKTPVFWLLLELRKEKHHPLVYHYVTENMGTNTVLLSASTVWWVYIFMADLFSFLCRAAKSL